MVNVTVSEIAADGTTILRPYRGLDESVICIVPPVAPID
jgi:hypothetical protein